MTPVPPDAPRLPPAPLLVSALLPILGGAAIGLGLVRGEHNGPLDPFGLLLEVAGTLALLRGLATWPAARRALRESRPSTLELDDERLRLVVGDDAREFAREDVEALVATPAGRLWLVVNAPERFVALPPAFGEASARQLALWHADARSALRTEIAEAAEATHHEENASSRYDELERAHATGTPPPAGYTLLALGDGWRRRVPVAGAVGALWFAAAALRSPLALGPVPLVGLVGLALPVSWWLRTRRELIPRRGLAAACLPEELLVRTRHGVHRVRWDEVERVRVVRTLRQLPILGGLETRMVALVRRDESTLWLDEAQLSAPPEAVRALIESYRRAKRAPTVTDESAA